MLSASERFGRSADHTTKNWEGCHDTKNEAISVGVGASWYHFGGGAMRICVLTEKDPSQAYGSWLRPVNLARGLARLGHRVERVPRGRFNGREKFDVIHAQVLWPALMAELSGSGTPVVADHHSILCEELREFGRPKWKVEAALALQKLSARLPKHNTAASAETAETISGWGVPKGHVSVVPNGVDTSVFKKLPGKKSDIRKRCGLPVDGKIVVFTAPRSFKSNVLALEFLFRGVPLMKRYADATFLILGGGPQISAPPRGVIYKGYVDDLNAYLNAADMAILPYPKNAICGGARTKALEYFAAGLPVLSTKEGLRGLDGIGRGDVVTCESDSPRQLAEKIENTLGNKALLERLGERSLNLARERTWLSSAKILEKVLQDVIV